MRYLSFILLITINFNQRTFSQTDLENQVKNILFLELAGHCGYGSVNYERIILKKNSFLTTIRLGIGTYNLVDFMNRLNPDILLPFLLNGLYGHNHKLELGIGATYSNIVFADFSNYKRNRESNLNTILCFGYRFQKNSNGILFRATYTPIIELNKYFRHWAGISIGYSF
jgi:hypothetical protein